MRTQTRAAQSVGPTADSGRYVAASEVAALELQVEQQARELQALRVRIGELEQEVDSARLLQLRERQNQRHQELLVGIVSHDLRNPLGAMVTAASMLKGHEGIDEK